MRSTVRDRPLPVKGKTALVTGASSGIGRAIAEGLADLGANVVLAARRRDRLETIADGIRARGVTARIVPVDLTEDGASDALFNAAVAEGRVDFLVNNAGVGLYGAFVGQPWEAQDRLIRLNILALTGLTHRFVHHMLEHEQPSGILHVSSIAAFQATPGFAVYGPTKSYVRDFSEALAYELSGTNVRVSCLIPGATRTEFSDSAGQELKRLAERVMMTPEEVAAIGIAALRRGRRAVVAGRMNKMNALATRLMPRRVSAWMVDFARRSSVKARGE
jgi:short-subunit dehydrogenase